jgi:hypothetical protein
MALADKKDDEWEDSMGLAWLELLVKYIFPTVHCSSLISDLKAETLVDLMISINKIYNREEGILAESLTGNAIRDQAIANL